MQVLFGCGALSSRYLVVLLQLILTVSLASAQIPKVFTGTGSRVVRG